MMDEIHATTVICVRRDGAVAMAGDGQVTVGNTVMKHGAAKVRRLYHDKILAGFAGGAADAFALFSRFEAKLEEYRGKGYGKALLVALTKLAVERGCGRLEWAVLDWNEPALGFYRKLGAKPMDTWTTYRLQGEALTELASS